MANRGGRAIAGLSQGGFCSMSYAARHPDLFGVALSFSGAPDTAFDPVARELTTLAVTDAETALDHVPAGSIFGPRSTQELNWAAHDPTTLAPNLRGIKLMMFTGNGQTGPLDRSPTSLSATIESGVQVLSTLFHDRLRSLGIPSSFDDYGPGTHAWPYWNRDLRQSIGADHGRVRPSRAGAEPGELHQRGPELLGIRLARVDAPQGGRVQHAGPRRHPRVRAQGQRQCDRHHARAV